MKATIVSPKPEYAPPAFRPAPRSGYLHIAASVAPPGRVPIVRSNAGRTALLNRLKPLAAALRAVPGVRKVTAYRAVLVPPVGSARYDVAVLIETETVADLDGLRGSRSYQDIRSAITAAATDVHVLAAHCLRCIGEVDRDRPGLFLFNHFTSEDREVATDLWEHLAGWYVAETGLDNSTLLAPIDGADSDFVFVNHARWDKGLLRLAADQFLKKSFRDYVVANLRANRTIAMPVLYRLAFSGR